ncbi:MAG: hydroxyisourate hydrolase [Candidatus Sericytochromatia bacterium]|nr:hydroxyisourate hydrolase [Candidatus Tanganyikabacteria bacterium]
MSSPITTHVLDTARGRPAPGVGVVLYRLQGEVWREVGRGETDADGRNRELLSGAREAGTYRIAFDTAGYFERIGVARYFFPVVEIVFILDEPEQHYHVPLLISPFGFSTYRGS